MALDLDAMVERAEKWRDLTPLAKEDFAEDYADDLAAYVLSLVEEVLRLREALDEALVVLGSETSDDEQAATYLKLIPVLLAASSEGDE